MAGSTTPRPTAADHTHAVAQALAAWPAEAPVAVAFSGGADSTALLLASVVRWPGQVHAIHVHHGLQRAADDFAGQCACVCAGLEVPLELVHVDARPARGESPEDAARVARYAALAEAAQRLKVRRVLLAQHADDQVETLLLALSRGAGLPGLAGMPATFERHGAAFGRPLLGVSGAQIRRWLADRGATWVEDPTNADTALTRNRIRHALLPVLETVFPQFRATFGRSARHAAQAQLLLDELAAADLARTGSPPSIKGLREMSRPRRVNALRHWLRTSHGTAASAAQLDELLAQIQACSTRGHRIRIKVGTGFVVREGPRLQFVAPL
ncbi:MAG: tRNA lysidine(34) synthetase TilS [Ramlibacter sp.]|nr:tRNA lysidine(34) synthetase TilS [Ramlibacter sp.]